jgi:hypothetical protein
MQWTIIESAKCYVSYTKAPPSKSGQSHRPRPGEARTTITFASHSQIGKPGPPDALTSFRVSNHDARAVPLRKPIWPFAFHEVSPRSS